MADEAKKLNEQVADMQIELKRAGEIREAENADFQTTVQDQRATAEIVKKARGWNVPVGQRLAGAPP